jgi:hypothetical protein
MGHPLTPDLSKLTEDELQKKRSELQNRLMMSYRMGNPDLVMQIQLILQDYDIEIQTRNQKLMDQMQKQSKNFGNIINISR